MDNLKLKWLCLDKIIKEAFIISLIQHFEAKSHEFRINPETFTHETRAPGDQVWDLLYVQLASYLEGGPLMWMMPLHVNKKSNYINP